MKKILKKIDKPLLFFMVLYSIIGLLLVLSASSVAAVVQYQVNPYYFFFKQLLFVVTAYAFGFIFILRFPIKNYKKFIPILLIGVVVALIGLLVYGQMNNSAKSWFKIGFASIQPSEFAKLIIILYLGFFFGSYMKKPHTKYGFIVPIIYSIIVFGLVALQPDLGTATIIGGIVLLTFLALPIKNDQNIKLLKILAGAGGIIAIVFLANGSSFLTKEQLSRFEYKEPCQRYIEKTGYQVCNGFIAINNGGLFGKGLGNSTQKYLYLPEAHTDFIFPIAVEELGVIIAIVLILGYLFIIFRIILIAKQASNLRNSIICYGIASYITLHLLINFLGILALMPLTGVPVPFFSYGGSFTLNIIISMFIVERISVENKNDLLKKEIKQI